MPMKVRHYIATVFTAFALLLVVVFAWAHLSLENVRHQRRLIDELERVPCRIKFHDDRYVAPVWLQARYFDKPLRCLKRIEFDFEDHRDVTDEHIRSLACFSQLEAIHSQVTGSYGRRPFRSSRTQTPQGTRCVRLPAEPCGISEYQSTAKPYLAQHLRYESD